MNISAWQPQGLDIVCTDAISSVFGLLDPSIAPSLLYYSYIPIIFVVLLFGIAVFLARHACKPLVLLDSRGLLASHWRRDPALDRGACISHSFHLANNRHMACASHIFACQFCISVRKRKAASERLAVGTRGFFGADFNSDADDL